MPAIPASTTVAWPGTRAGDAHHQREVRDEAVVRAEHRRAQRVAAAERAMAASRCGRSASRSRPRAGRGQQREDARVVALILDEAGGLGDGSASIHGVGAGLEVLDHRQHEVGTEAPREPHQDPRAQRGLARGVGCAGLLELLLPELRGGAASLSIMRP